MQEAAAEPRLQPISELGPLAGLEQAALELTLSMLGDMAAQQLLAAASEGHKEGMYELTKLEGVQAQAVTPAALDGEAAAGAVRQAAVEEEAAI